ncbi:MAG: M20/M25/M40 family metallo-hydrolase [Prevotellaceae bacterium]|nr:M20/M25/M40 family metallo-hydrolase [Prevotellaceae bacterium]
MKHLLVIVLWGLLSCCTPGNGSLLSAQDYDFGCHLHYLASDSLQGRLAGSRYDSLAAVYIRSTLLHCGYAPLCENGWQQFEYNAIKRSTNKQGTRFSRNVVMVRTPYDTSASAESIVLGAHFDHLGLGGWSSYRSDTVAVHNGADDNASGVAMLLELAKKITQYPAPLKRNVVIVAFGAEELGLLGSNYFVKNLPPHTGKIVLMINFDMVGRLDTLRRLEIGGLKSFAGADSLLHAIPNPDSLTFFFPPKVKENSDHAPFYAAGIPILFFHTGLHADYHTPDDDIDKINIPGMHAIAHFADSLIRWAVTTEEPPVFQQTGFARKSQ